MKAGSLKVDARPGPVQVELDRVALLIIDMQRDFLEPGGFGEMLGNDIAQLRRAIEPNQKLLAAGREKGGKCCIPARVTGLISAACRQPRRFADVHQGPSATTGRWDGFWSAARSA